MYNILNILYLSFVLVLHLYAGNNLSSVVLREYKQEDNELVIDILHDSADTCSKLFISVIR